jgi:hypothetical protein
MFILRPDALSLNGSVMINQTINQSPAIGSTSGLPITTEFIVRKKMPAPPANHQQINYLLSPRNHLLIKGGFGRMVYQINTWATN